MTKFKYLQKVRVKNGVRDGFYSGSEGTILTRKDIVIDAQTLKTAYMVELQYGRGETFYEEEIEAVEI